MYILRDYDNNLTRILEDGVKRTNRTGIETLSMFGVTSRYRIDKCFPIPTRRKAFPKSIFAELLWMLSGSTDINELNKMGSKIWDFWRSKEFEEKNNYEDGALGPTYGHSFRNFGGDYPIKGRMYTHDPSLTGFDQVLYLINELKKNKYSRRALINLWDPRVMTTDKVRLPTCHFVFQVLVDDKDRLTGILTQRSGDWLPGVSANVYFYSAFLYMIAQQLGFTPYELVHNVADAHVYVDQIPAAKEYLTRPERPSPTLELQKAKDIFSYSLSDFVLKDYEPGDAIKVPVAV